MAKNSNETGIALAPVAPELQKDNIKATRTCEVCRYGCACDDYYKFRALSDAPEIEVKPTTTTDVIKAEKEIATYGNAATRKLARFAARRFWASGYGQLEQAPVEQQTYADYAPWLSAMRGEGSVDAATVEGTPNNYVELRPFRGKLAYMAVMSLAAVARRRGHRIDEQNERIARPDEIVIPVPDDLSELEEAKEPALV